MIFKICKSRCCTPETYTVSQINYTSKEQKFKNKEIPLEFSCIKPTSHSKLHLLLLHYFPLAKNSTSSPVIQEQLSGVSLLCPYPY